MRRKESTRYIRELPIRLLLRMLVGWNAAAVCCCAQAFVAGQAGAAAISNAAAAQAQPVASASNYDSKVGPAAMVAGGYHINDWFSVQLAYNWNRNHVLITEVAGGALQQRTLDLRQHTVATELMLYFRPRGYWIRPYLAAGPGFSRFLNETSGGLKVTVGADLRLAKGVAFRYSFGEMATANPLAKSLRPGSNARMMNFQNLFGFVKTF